MAGTDSAQIGNLEINGSNKGLDNGNNNTNDVHNLRPVNDIFETKSEPTVVAGHAKLHDVIVIHLTN